MDYFKIFAMRLIYGTRKNVYGLLNVYRLFLLVSITFMLPSCKSGDGEADAYGNFEADEIIISAEVQGRILNFPPSEGDLITPDLPLAEIDSTALVLKKGQLYAGLNANSARIKGLEAQVEVLRIQLENMEREYERISRLLNDGAATKKQYDDLEGQIRQLKAQIVAQEAQKEPLLAEKQSFLSQIDQLNDQIRRTRVLSPISATILAKYKEAGEITVPGQALCKVADLGHLFLRAYISGKQLTAVKLGQNVSVKVDSGDTLISFPGRITWISSQAEFTPKIIQTREERVDLVYAVKIEVANDGSLKIGMPGEMKIEE